MTILRYKGLNLLSGAKYFIVYVLAGCFFSAAWPYVCAAERISPSIPPAVAERLSQGMTQDIIVLFADRDVEAEADMLRHRARIDHDDTSVLAVRRTRYLEIKQSVMGGFATHELEEIRDYDQLPMSLIRFKSRAALDRLLADPRMQAIYEDSPVYPHLSYSLPFIGQPTVAGVGFRGDGQTVAVIDSGIDYTLPAFGSCSAPETPASCRVVASVDVTGHDVTLNQTTINHGTNIAGIVAGVAPGAQVAAINAFYNNGSTISWIIAGIEWAIANKETYNIVTLNMSLGDNVKYTSPCGNIYTNPYVTPINNLRAAGIIPVASSGNNGFSNGMGSPACTPGVVSIGAVYDANWGGPITWSTSGCTDSTSAPDRIPCSSNSASFLTMLAPGAYVTAAGIQKGGTSQAAAHVAGSLAVLRAAYPADTLDQTVAHLTSGGVAVTDSRNGITKPRLNLTGAISPPDNDLFVNRILLNDDNGQTTGHNLNATKESGELLHAGNSGGKSVWWLWAPSVSGVASFNTHGSSFNTLLAVYGGATLSGLGQIAANDNDGSSGNTSGVTFTAEANNQYLIAVDGFSGAAGGILLNWSLLQQADLGIALSQSPAAISVGDQVTCTVTVSNYGPSAASGVVVSNHLSAGIDFVSASPGCSMSMGTVTCTLGTLPANTSTNVLIVINVQVAGDLSNSVQVSSTTSDPQAANNIATATAIVSQVDAAVPALSHWGIMVAALCLAAVARKANKRSPSPEARFPSEI